MTSDSDKSVGRSSADAVAPANVQSPQRNFVPDASYTRRWSETGSLRSLRLDNGQMLRYLVDGIGPPLVLMHTARSQLDYFQLMVPLLRHHFAIHAIDLPGHGWSSIDHKQQYDEPLLRAAVTEFMEKLDLRNATLAGDSIGAVLALTLAAQTPQRVTRVVAVNPFDYPGGVRRANLVANVILGTYGVPGLGWMFSNLESEPILAAILRGGFHDGRKLPGNLVREFRRVGRRRGYQRMFRSLVGAMPSFIAARETYRQVSVPVTLVYGEADWSQPAERNANAALVPNSELIELAATGHFASLESPERIARILLAEQPVQVRPLPRHVPKLDH